EYGRAVASGVQGARGGEGRTRLLGTAQHVTALPGHTTEPRARRVRGWPTRLAPGVAACQLCPAPTDPGVARSHARSRALTRYRKTLVEWGTQQITRIHTVLETAHLKLGAVASNVVGVSGRRMLRAVAHGESDAAVLADLAKGRLREKL